MPRQMAKDAGDDDQGSTLKPLIEQHEKIKPFNPNQDQNQPQLTGGTGRKFVTRTTKFRHLKGTILNREHHITMLPSLCRTIGGECNQFKISQKFAALPVGNSPNQLMIVQLKGQRLERGLMPTLMTGPANIGDFAFDPFNPNRIAVGCSDAQIRFWDLPDGGLVTKNDQPSFVLTGHTDRITIVQFHPLAADILTTASIDLTVRVWDVQAKTANITISGLSAPLFGLAWHPDGKLLATLSKDQKLRIYDPRNDATTPVQEGPGPQGARGGRVTWANNGTQLVVSGFSRVSERQIILYDAHEISKPLATEGIDVNPAILVPHYDEGSSTLFLTGKGDRTIFAYEISPVADGAPYIHALSHVSCPSGSHQSMDFLPKIECNVRAVEFARAYRLTNSTIEPISFTVPRVRTEYFQNDLFGPERCTWKMTIKGSQWLAGHDMRPILVELRPDDMELLSNAPALPQSTPKKSFPIISAARVAPFDPPNNVESAHNRRIYGQRMQDSLAARMSSNIGNKYDKSSNPLVRSNRNGAGGEDEQNEWDDSDPE